MIDDLRDAENLFGNEAGEDEDVEVLKTYFVEKKDFDAKFYSDKKHLAFVRSRKGVGKSALLKYTMQIHQETDKEDFFIFVKASDLIALKSIGSEHNSYECINGWQQRICSRINMEIGSKIGAAFTDDTMTLVESSELAGFRQRNIIGALTQRLHMKMNNLEIQQTAKSQANSQELLKRFENNTDRNVWIFIDDIDANFVNSELKILNVSSFFTACRNLVNNVNGLYIRASARSDVWNLLKDDDLDKCEQYMYDLKWTRQETGLILTKKIFSYFDRKYPGRFPPYLPGMKQQDISSLVFKGGKLKWGTKFLDPSGPIHILSAGRPRWATVLCKLAAKCASDNSRDTIEIRDINDALYEYGNLRLNDLYKEHKHQCSQLVGVIHAFSAGCSSYKLKELLDCIDRNIIQKMPELCIDNKETPMSSLEVANFLYRIGFISLNDVKFGYLRFEDRPDLLESDLNLDYNQDWVIHPSYRKVLNIVNKDNNGSIS